MTNPAVSPAVLLVAGERFFLKEVPLDPAVGVAGQVELAIEASSPFPLAQLYHGFMVSADRRLALGYAAYRRRFATDELADWPDAAAVVPEFLALIGPPPASPMIVVQSHPDGLNGVAWNGQSGIPAAIMARSLSSPTDANLKEMVDELRRRAALSEAVEVRRLEGPAGVGNDEDGAAVFRIAGEETAKFAAAAIADADVRDKSFLDEKRREETRRRGWVWGLTAAAGLLLTAACLDLAAGGLGIWNQRQRERVEARADEVRRIETAQTLATRIEDLTARQERPLEWLSLVSSLRPRTIQFLRVVSDNDRTLTIDAQTTDAAAVGAYEAALRQRDEMEEVVTRDLRSREGMTSFVLAVRFKPPGSGTGGKTP